MMYEQQIPGDPEALASAIEREPDLESLRADLDAARAAQARAVADYQNLLRRSRDERAEWSAAAVSGAVSAFLPVIDDLERAIDATPGEMSEQPWAEGVRLVVQKFRGVLEQSGVTEIHALGKPFDPARHEATGTAPGPEGTVVYLVRRGYALGDRVVRPVMVIVGAGAPAGAEATGAHDAQMRSGDSVPRESEA
ncbi:MAG: nucleotide exchange factor GrpE [Dehalococcoidia bacterium]|nr:nucleotide exchange factor GrpE [Dehalococcoidia bacterium]